jgi:IMP dehydrogenase
LKKTAAEGVEAIKEAAGPVSDVLATLVGGLQSGMGYLGAVNLASLRDRALYCRVSPAGQKEAAPHDIIELKASTTAK